ARAPAPLRREPRRTGARERPVQSPHLPFAEAQQRGRPAPRQPPLGNSGHEVQPVQFRHRQRHRLRHRATVAARRTFLLGRNRTFAFGAYTLASEIGRYVNFPRLSLYGPQNQKATSIPTSGTGSGRTPSPLTGSKTLPKPKIVSRQMSIRPPIARS